MNWQASFTTVLSAGVLWATTTAAFTVERPRFVVSSRHTIDTQLHVGGRGWDNDNFLDALSGGNEERKDANEQYYSQSRFGRPEENEPAVEDTEDLSEGITKGAELTEEMKAKVKASHTEEEEASQGGRMFQEMMAKAKQGPARPPPPPPAAMAPPPPPPPPPVTNPPMNPESMSVEDQAAMFRQMMTQQQQQQPQAYPPQAYPPQAYPPQAYPPPQPYAAPPPQAAPQNYLAPGTGPDGNRVGRNKDADSIVNTSDVYLAQLKRDSSVRNEARYSGDDEFSNKVFGDPAIQEIKLHTNPYMEEARRKEREMIDTVPEEMIDPSMFVREEVDKSYSGISYKERLQQRRNKKTPTAPVAPAPRTTAPAPAAPEPVAPMRATAPADPVAPAQPSAPADPPAPMESPGGPPGIPQATGNVEKDTRTTMGLLLKHRGGPGFGSGRLKGPEMERFDEMSSDLLRTLRQEASSDAAATFATTAGGATSTNQAGMERADAMIKCIEGAVQMYKNSPPELRESAMNTLRSALLSAVTTCNELIANKEVENVQAFEAATGTPTSAKTMPKDFYSVIPQTEQHAASTPDAGKTLSPETTAAPVEPAQVGAVVKPEVPKVETEAVDKPEVPKVETKSYSGNDENSKMFDSIYDKLKNAAGDGKMGLRKNLTPQEAKELTNDITDMRMLLLDELETGIPENGIEKASKYQEQLAKARAEKEANE